MNKISIVCVFLAASLSLGCATVKDSLLTGLVSGAAIGAAGGSTMKSKNRNKSIAVGALVGAALGTLIGHSVHKDLKKRDAQVRRDTLFNLDKFDVSQPNGRRFQGERGLTLPIVDSEYIDEHVTEDGTKLIEGHKVWKIQEGVQWIPKADSDE